MRIDSPAKAIVFGSRKIAYNIYRRDRKWKNDMLLPPGTAFRRLFL